MAKIHGWIPSKYQPYPNKVNMRIACFLYDMNTTEDVFWSKNSNSYCLVEITNENSWLGTPLADRFFWKDEKSGKMFQLCSINGAGEIRWSVTKDRVERILENEKADWWEPDANWDDNEIIAAARHFNLAPKK